MFKLGKSLGQKTQDQIAEVIARHLDAFAWSASNMPGIDPDFLSIALQWTPRSDLFAKGGESSTRRGDRSSKKRHGSC